jgi:hypothetical protein
LSNPDKVKQEIDLEWKEHKCKDCGAITSYVEPGEPTCAKCALKEVDAPVKLEPIEGELSVPGEKWFDVVTCQVCKHDYGMVSPRPKIVISSSIDCPYCAESQPHIKHVNGFRLPTIQSIDAGEWDHVCMECGDKANTLEGGICNTCLSEKDDSDVINWPKHYNTGKIQPIDAIEDWKLDFRLANAVKYIARCEHKENAQKDLEKAIWYIQRYIDKELKEK